MRLANARRKLTNPFDEEDDDESDDDDTSDTSDIVVQEDPRTQKYGKRIFALV